MRKLFLFMKCGGELNENFLHLVTGLNIAWSLISWGQNQEKASVSVSSFAMMLNACGVHVPLLAVKVIFSSEFGPLAHEQILSSLFNF